MQTNKILYTLENIDEITSLDYGYFRDDLDYSIKTLQNLGLLTSYQKCFCGDQMFLVKRKSADDGYQYKCQLCNKRKSIRVGTIFEFSRLPLWKIFIFIVTIIQHPNMTYEEIRKHVQIASNSTIKEWKDIVTDFMASKLDEEYMKIGGKDVIVQIDETAISKRKYDVGRILRNQQHWMVGGIDENGNFFLKITQKRNKEILERIILDNVEEESTIWTDGWKGYNSLKDLGFIHGTVIHKRRFVSPEGVHTNRIEATWGAFKRKYRNATNKTPETLPSYVADFMFRRKYYGKELSTLFKYIMVNSV